MCESPCTWLYFQAIALQRAAESGIYTHWVPCSSSWAVLSPWPAFAFRIASIESASFRICIQPWTDVRNQPSAQDKPVCGFLKFPHTQKSTPQPLLLPHCPAVSAAGPAPVQFKKSTAASQKLCGGFAENQKARETEWHTGFDGKQPMERCCL